MCIYIYISNIKAYAIDSQIKNIYVAYFTILEKKLINVALVLKLHKISSYNFKNLKLFID